jgi:hypothetical protein
MLFDEEETTNPSSKIINSDSKARRAIEKHKSGHYLILFLALFGSCMTIGAAVLTPALSGTYLPLSSPIYQLIKLFLLFIYLIFACLSVLSASYGVQRSLSEMASLCKCFILTMLSPNLFIVYILNFLLYIFFPFLFASLAFSFLKDISLLAMLLRVSLITLLSINSFFVTAYSGFCVKCSTKM